MPSRIQAKGSQNELECLIRGVCGGFVFAIPILYTMEVWWLGHSMPTWKLLLYLAVGYVLLVGLNVFSGFRDAFKLEEYLMDGVTALGLGALVALAMLWMMGVAGRDTPFRLVVAETAVLAVPIGVGISLARSVLGGGQAKEPLKGIRADLQDVGMTVIGGIFVGLSLAPTEEIVLISLRAGWARLVAVVLLSLLLSYALLFMANFMDMPQRPGHGMLQSPWGETVVSYVISLGVSLGLLWFMGYVQSGVHPYEILTMVVMMGLPVTIGGAAGRLVV